MIFNGIMHTIHLQDILYVSGNQNNLFSLRHWLTKGGDFSGQDLALISKVGNTIANRMLTFNNLIKLKFCYTKDNIVNNADDATTSLSVS